MEAIKESYETSDWVTMQGTPSFRFGKENMKKVNVCYGKKNNKYSTKRLSNPKLVNGLSSRNMCEDKNSTIRLDGKPFEFILDNLSPINKKEKRTRIVPLKVNILRSISSPSESSHSKVSQWLATTQYADQGPVPDNEMHQNYKPVNKASKAENMMVAQQTDELKIKLTEENTLRNNEVEEISPIGANDSNENPFEILENSNECLIGQQIVNSQPTTNEKQSKGLVKKRKKRRRITMPPNYKPVKEKIPCGFQSAKKNILKGRKLPFSPIQRNKLWIRRDCPYQLRGTKLELSLKQQSGVKDGNDDNATLTSKSFETPMDKSNLIVKHIGEMSKRRLSFQPKEVNSSKKPAKVQSANTKSNATEQSSSSCS